MVIRNWRWPSDITRQYYRQSFNICPLSVLYIVHIVRDRPFNLQGGEGGLWFFVSFRIFFLTTQEFEYLFLLSRKVRNFFPEFNIRLCDKNSESDNFFFPLRIYYNPLAIVLSVLQFYSFLLPLWYLSYNVKKYSDSQCCWKKYSDFGGGKKK
jgi:hypothetical protein